MISLPRFDLNTLSLAIVDDAGKFTEETGELLSGLDVLTKGTQTVLQVLKDKGLLLHTEQYSHKYPYDWRTKKPIIIR